MSVVLIIDDEEKLRNLLSRIIELEGFEVLQAGDSKSAFRKLENSDVDVVICDVKLPDGNGVEITRKIKEKYPHAEVILLTAYGNIPDGIQAMKYGAFDYITKGDDNNKILPLIYKASEKVELARRVISLERQLGDKYSFDNIIGRSKKLLEVVELARKVAVTDTIVLLTGETGTGKEVFAQAIHHASPRRTKNFIAVNCSAISPGLLESELFGYKRGAFTGAEKDRKGLFEEAHNGTIFLDEIGEMSPDLQAKLLRVIESGEFIKVGDNKPSKVNVRIVAATNRDLQKEMEHGNFREDLYYRISVFQIQLPSLRERVDDIGVLAEHFVKYFCVRTRKRSKRISGEFITALKLHDWKGNIRELRNLMERTVIISDDEILTPDLLPQEFSSERSGESRSLSAFELASAEKIHIQKVLNYSGGNKTRTAELLGIALTTLYRKIEEYGIN